MFLFAFRVFFSGSHVYLSQRPEKKAEECPLTVSVRDTTRISFHPFGVVFTHILHTYFSLLRMHITVYLHCLPSSIWSCNLYLCFFFVASLYFRYFPSTLRKKKANCLFKRTCLREKGHTQGTVLKRTSNCTVFKDKDFFCAITGTEQTTIQSLSFIFFAY